jgi:KUP system potassium uptake protein
MIILRNITFYIEDNICKVPKKAALPATALAALGVVFGDIGTSPLYALKESFHAAHGLGIQPENVLGILSIIFWCLMLIISIKYIAIVMRADNNGEGGIMASTCFESTQKNIRQ